MNKSEEIADGIIKEAYKNDGEIYSNKSSIKLENLPSNQFKAIRQILRTYGTFIPSGLFPNVWKYLLSQKGHVFARQGAFEGLEKTRREKREDRKLDRTSKKISIIAVIIAFVSLVVSIIALCSKQ